MKFFKNIRITSDFSETTQAKREWSEMFTVERKKPTNTEFQYPANYSSKVKKK